MKHTDARKWQDGRWCPMLHFVLHRRVWGEMSVGDLSVDADIAAHTLDDYAIRLAANYRHANRISDDDLDWWSRGVEWQPSVDDAASADGGRDET